MSSMTTDSALEQLIAAENIVDIRFFPSNLTDSSVEDLLSSAIDALEAHKKGQCYEYNDDDGQFGADIDTFTMTM